MIELIKHKVEPHLLGSSFKIDVPISPTNGNIVGVAVYVPISATKIVEKDTSIVFDGGLGILQLLSLNEGLLSKTDGSFATASVSVDNGDVISPAVPIQVKYGATLNKIIIPVDYKKPYSSVRIVVNENVNNVPDNFMPVYDRDKKFLFAYDVECYIIRRKGGEEC